MAQQNTTKKLTDKAFSRLIILAVSGILLSIFCLCSTTYAWFVASIPNTGNAIQTADECLLAVSVSRDGSELERIEDGVALEAGVPYSVTLTLPSDSASGYCLVTAGGEVYYTAYLARHNDPEPKSVSFTVMVGSAQTIKFTPKWGIYAGESDLVDGALFIP